MKSLPGEEHDLKDKVRLIPNKPGAYIFKDKNKEVLYVGKAKDLKKRIKSYFYRSSSFTPRLEMMLKRIEDFEIYTTANELEALILEYNLIKKHRPRFNVFLRDDKSYPYIAVTTDDEFPRIFVTRNLRDKNSKYYGPYTNPKALRKTLDTLRKIFPIRSCRSKEPGRRNKNPCLNYHIGKCPAPCSGKVKRKEYKRIVDKICDFLEGKGEMIIKELEKEMKEAAREERFEKAALIRDKIDAARLVLQKQKVVLDKKKDLDVIGKFEAEEETYFKVMFVREGKLVGSRGYFYAAESLEKPLFSLLEKIIIDSGYLPKEVIIPEGLETVSLDGLVADVHKKKVRFVHPAKGEKKELLKMANENAAHSYMLSKYKSTSGVELLSELLNEAKDTFKLDRVPYRIECYDVSNLSGKEAVASMVVFEDASPRKKDYKRFKIRNIDKPNDFLMLKEVLSRRLTKMQNKDERFKVKPDLILVDGGKPQLSAASSALRELGIEDIPVIALAKKEELFFTKNLKDPVSLRKKPMLEKMFQRIRDESHRFALSYHRKLRQKKMRSSRLDDIKGIGEKRKQLLLKKFGSIKGIKEASFEKIREVVPESVARQLIGLDAEDKV